MSKKIRVNSTIANNPQNNIFDLDTFYKIGDTTTQELQTNSLNTAVSFNGAGATVSLFNNITSTDEFKNFIRQYYGTELQTRLPIFLFFDYPEAQTACMVAVMCTALEPNFTYTTVSVGTDPNTGEKAVLMFALLQNTQKEEVSIYTGGV